MSLFLELVSGKWMLKPTKSGAATNKTWKPFLRTVLTVRCFLRTIYEYLVVPQELATLIYPRANNLIDHAVSTTDSRLLFNINS